MRARRQIVSETYLSVSRRICWANRRERGRGNEYVIGWRAISGAAVSFVVSRDLAKKTFIPCSFPFSTCTCNIGIDPVRRRARNLLRSALKFRFWLAADVNAPPLTRGILDKGCNGRK